MIFPPPLWGGLGRGKTNSGIALIASVMLIVFASIAILSITVFIIQRLTQNVAKQRSASAIDLAHAGIQNALYFYRFRDLMGNGYFTLGQTNIDADNYFVLSDAAGELLMVNTSTAALGGASNRDLLNLSIQNATNSQTVTINRMVVSWNNARTLRRIRINGAVVWSGTLTSPANADITNFTLNTTPTIYPINELRFSGNMTGATISIQFVMTDGSIRNLTVFPASNNNVVTVTSTGWTTGSNIFRTIKADYNALTARIINYAEQ